MQIAQSKILRPVYQHGVGIWDIHPVFHNGGRYQYIIVAVDEVQNLLFQLNRLHLTVGYANAGLWTHKPYLAGDSFYILHPVVDKIDLAATLHLKFYYIPDGVGVKINYLGVYRYTVRRRGRYY